MSVREAVSRVRLSFGSGLQNTLNYGGIPATRIFQNLLQASISSGINAFQANRLWFDRGRTLAMNQTEDIDLYDFFGIDSGAGPGMDGIGLPLSVEEVVAFILKQTAGPGRLEVMPAMPVGGVTWMPRLTVANGGALKSGSAMLLYQPNTNAFDIVDGVSHVARFRAIGGSVTYDMFLLGRHDDGVSSSTISSLSASSSSSQTTSLSSSSLSSSLSLSTSSTLTSSSASSSSSISPSSLSVSSASTSSTLSSMSNASVSSLSTLSSSTLSSVSSSTISTSSTLSSSTLSSSTLSSSSSLSPAELTATAIEYNQITLDWGSPLPGATIGDYYEIQISTDGGMTWEENFRVIPYDAYDRSDNSGRVPSFLATASSGGPASGSYIEQTEAFFAGFDPDTTYHFRMRTVRWAWPTLTYGAFTSTASATTPSYVVSGTTNTGGQVRVISNRADWVALNGVVAFGDIVELSLSATDFFILPAWIPQAAAGSGKWVTVRSAGYQNSSLKYDKRATLADKSNMATVWIDGTVNGTVQAVGTLGGSDFYSFEGIHFECRKTGGGQPPNGAIGLGNNGIGNITVTNIDLLSSHIEFHRCVCDKTTNTTDSNEGVMIDSFFGVLKDCHIVGGGRVNGAETHGVVAITSEHITIDNCYIAAASIVGFQGSPSSINGLNNKNWLWKRNYLTREAEWKSAPVTYGMKNLLEFKRAVHSIVTRNIFEFNRFGSNQFSSILYHPRQTGQVGSEFHDFRFTYNKVLDVTRGITINNDVGGAPQGTLATRQLVIEHNLIEEIAGPTVIQTDKDTWFVEVTGDENLDKMTDIRIRHNTFIDPNGANQATANSSTSFFAGNTNPNILAVNYEFLDNVCHHLSEGIQGAPEGGTIVGTSALDGFCDGYTVTRNVFGNGNMTNNASGNYTVGTNGDASGNFHENQTTFEAHFENYSLQDYRIAAASPHKGAAPGGLDRGADIDALNAGTSHCIDGDWTAFSPLDVADIEMWCHAGANVYSDAGVTPAVDGSTVQQNTDQSPNAYVRSNATAGQRPKLRAASLAVPSLDFQETSDTALAFSTNVLDLRTNDATFFYVFSIPYPAADATPKRMAGNWAAGVKGLCIGISHGSLKQTFINDGGANYAGLSVATDEVTLGDVIIAAARWTNATGQLEIFVQKSDQSTLQLDVDDINASLAGMDIDSIVAFTMGRTNGQTTADATFREYHTAKWPRKLTNTELQDVADYFRAETDLVPQYWTLDRDVARNPLTTVPPGNTRESYYPQPFRIGSVPYMLCKGNSEVYLWKADDDASAFVLQNSNSPVLTTALAGSDGANSVTQGTVTYDSATGTLHSYTKGFDASNVPRVIHFTADDSNPTVWAKAGVVLDPTPFLPDAVIDINCDSVFKEGSTWHYFGSRGMVGGNYRFWHGTSTGWNDTITIQNVYTWPTANHGNTLVHACSVFKNPSSAGGYFMAYALGRYDNGDGERNLYMAYAPNLSVDEWQHVGTLLLHEPTGWETTRCHSAAILRQSTGEFALPEVINGKWHMYYSASNLTGPGSGWKDLAGLLLMTPLLT